MAFACRRRVRDMRMLMLMLMLMNPMAERMLVKRKIEEVVKMAARTTC
jgi:hypothetical protein